MLRVSIGFRIVALFLVAQLQTPALTLGADPKALASRSIIHGTRDGVPFVYRFRWTDMYIRRAGRWQAVSGQLTSLQSARDFFICRFLTHRGLDIGTRALLPYFRFIAHRRFLRCVGGSHGDCILPD
jgi:hypothetical protein